MDGDLDPRVIDALRRNAVLIFLGGLLLLACGTLFLSGRLQTVHARTWFLTALAVWGYFFALLWVNLTENRQPEGKLSSALGPANLLTLFRAVLMSAFAGLLVVPRPTGWAAWLPGALYIAAALPDFVDGIVARRTGRPTRLGEILDLNVDSIGVLAATTLAVLYGSVPVWYLAIGLARYLFVFGLRVRERLGLPVYDLPPSIRRRGFAALKMGFMFAVLFPFFRPPATHLAATALGVPFAAGFLWDWGLATGRIRPGTGGPGSTVVRLALEWLPVALRIAIPVIGLSVIAGHLAAPTTRAIAILEIGIAALIALGIAPRSAAILAVLLLGYAQNTVPLALAGSALVFMYVALVFLGGGRFSLLPVEERLITQRIGDPH